MVGSCHGNAGPAGTVLKLHEHGQAKGGRVAWDRVCDRARHWRLSTPVIVIKLNIAVEIRLCHLYPDAPAVIVGLLVERELEKAADEEAIAKLAEVAVELSLFLSLVSRNSPYVIRKFPTMIPGQAFVRFSASWANER